MRANKKKNVVNRNGWMCKFLFKLQIIDVFNKNKKDSTRLNEDKLT